MKSLFKPKHRAPAVIVRHTRNLLAFDHWSSMDNDKIADLCRNIGDLKSILYGDSDSEPVPDACLQLTQEFFREDTLRPLIKCLPMLDLEARKDVTRIVANLQRQQVQSRLIASEYLEDNLDIIDMLVEGFENEDLALHYSGMLKECVRHQVVAKYILESKGFEKFFDYVQLPYFDVAADANRIFRELLTRHKSTVTEYLTQNYDWFFTEYNTRLLEKGGYITKRQATKLLGDILMERSNCGVMVRYVSSIDNLRIMMNLLREPSKNIQIEAFHVFKLFVENEEKPEDIVGILAGNRCKIMHLLRDLKPEKENQVFEAVKSGVLKEIACLRP